MTDSHFNKVDADQKGEISSAVEAYEAFRDRAKKKVIKIPPVIIQNMRIKLTAWLLKMKIFFNKNEALVELMKALLDEFGSETIKSLTLSNTTSSKKARECKSASYYN